MAKHIPFDTNLNNGGQGSLRVPGFGLPIEYWPHADQNSEEFPETKVRFRHGVNDFRGERLTGRELAMLRLMNHLTDKQEWNRKVFDENIVAKWKDEALESHELMSDKAFDWCMTELRDKAKQYEKNKFVPVFDSESVCIKSDILIDQDFQAALKTAIQPLLNKAVKDWHPNTNEQVLNLVHPSLYPLVYGRTRVLTSGTVGLSNMVDSIGHGEIAAADQHIEQFKAISAYRLDANHPPQMYNGSLWSNRFQWLPAEVKFKGERGTDVEITSYINSLHPSEHSDLYALVERLISKAIPLWDQVLIHGLYGRVPERIKTFGFDFEPAQPGWAQWNMEETEEMRQKVREYLDQPNAPGYDSGDESEPPEDWDTNPDEMEEWPMSRVVEAKWKMIRQMKHPEPGVAFSYDDWKAGAVDGAVVTADSPKYLRQHEYYQVRLEEQFRDRGLQVIVKLAGIELTPDKPDFPAGSWHLEGMLNEHIVATAIYYYDVENTTDSSLAFRQEDIFQECGVYYEQFDHLPVYQLYDTTADDFSQGITELGSISTPGGRFLVFPNTLQHAVMPFSLADRTKPGHRRFMVLWLVDPHLRIMSTANVPPQQHDWWVASAAENAGINRFPPEVGKMIMDNTDDWPMGLDEAKALRLELMEERTSFGAAVENNLLEYNLCEH